MRRFLSSVVLLSLPATGWAATWTVCPTGCDYSTISDAENDTAVVLAGDIIEVIPAFSVDAIFIAVSYHLSHDLGNCCFRFTLLSALHMFQITGEGDAAKDSNNLYGYE